MSHNLSSAVAWFSECREDNTRDFWASNRERYASEVRAPFLAVLQAAGERPEEWRVYRPHNDTRFAKDRGPLKTFIGALHVATAGTGRYLQVDSSGMLASSGMPYLAPDQLQRWRTALGSDGSAFLTALPHATHDGVRVKSGYPEPLKRTPRGFEPDHPMSEFLRWKGVEVYGRRTDVDAVSDDWATDQWAAGGPLCAWLSEWVGPSTMERPKSGR